MSVQGDPAMRKKERALAIADLRKSYLRDLKDGFEDVKHGSTYRSSHVKVLMKHVDAVGPEYFFRGLQSGAARALIAPSDSKEATNVLDFVTDLLVKLQIEHIKKAASEQEEGADLEDPGVHPVVEDLMLPWLASSMMSDSRDSGTRFHVMYLISELFTKLPETTKLELGLYEKIQEVMLKRVRDVIPAIRVLAVRCMERMQDSSAGACRVTEALMFHAEKDVNWQVRKAAISSLQPCRATLSAFLGRISDVNANVRKQAYVAIGQKISLKAIKAGIREKIFSKGLTDPNEHVRNSVRKEILQKWKDSSAGILQLLQRLDLVGVPEAGTAITSTYFKKLRPYEVMLPITELMDPETRLVKPEALNETVAFYWTEAYHYLKEQARNQKAEVAAVEAQKPLKPFVEAPVSADEEEATEPENEQFFSWVTSLSKIEPEEFAFAQYLVEFFKAPLNLEAGNNRNQIEIARVRKDFIIEQLVRFTKAFALTDPSNRNALTEAFKTMLVSSDLAQDSVKCILDVFPKICSSTNDRIATMLDVVSEIRFPLQVSATREVPSEDELTQLRIKHTHLSRAVQRVKMEIDGATRKMDVDMISTLTDQLRQSKQELENHEAIMNKAIECAKLAEEEAEKCESRDDPESVRRALDVIYGTLSELKMDKIPDSLQVLKEQFVIPSISSGDAKVRNRAVAVLGQLCVFCLDTARTNFALLLQISKLDADFVVVSALKSIFDIMLRWGAQVFVNAAEMPLELLNPTMSRSHQTEATEVSVGGDEDGVDRDVKNAVFRNLMMILGQEFTLQDEEIRATCALGLSKLMLRKLWRNSTVLSRLILLFFNPAKGGSNPKVQQVLMGFFTFFSLDADNTDVILDSFFSTMRTVQNSPVYSQLAAIRLDDMISLLVDMALNLDRGNAENPAQESIAFRLLGELKSPEMEDDATAKVFARTLVDLKIPAENYVSIHSLRKAASAVLKAWEESPVVGRSLKRFIQACDMKLEQAPEGMQFDNVSEVGSEARGASPEAADSMLACHSQQEIEPDPTIESDIEGEDEDATAVGVRPVGMRRSIHRQRTEDGEDFEIHPSVCQAIPAQTLREFAETTEEILHRSKKDKRENTDTDDDSIFEPGKTSTAVRPAKTRSLNASVSTINEEEDETTVEASSQDSTIRNVDADANGKSDAEESLNEKTIENVSPPPKTAEPEKESLPAESSPKKGRQAADEKKEISSEQVTKKKNLEVKDKAPRTTPKVVKKAKEPAPTESLSEGRKSLRSQDVAPARTRAQEAATKKTGSSDASQKTKEKQSKIPQATRTTKRRPEASPASATRNKEASAVEASPPKTRRQQRSRSSSVSLSKSQSVVADGNARKSLRSDGKNETIPRQKSTVPKAVEKSVSKTPVAAVRRSSRNTSAQEEDVVAGTPEIRSAMKSRLLSRTLRSRGGQ
ncbi:unnamed protein product [Notodromas monacha]|uniref:Nuclear condensin complex subunit 3 C-terminal domain-containing protein n=1 Tax=Notodromas monacha TaxID=399045 RepID=A0A7R9BL50_9CRUS|nr:unnamed protein product [Notodromas monacha]CAG0916010.1 unnamed protein product [Notodromas monacha]